MPLSKWSSNVPELEADNSQQEKEPSVEQSYAKSQLMVKPREMNVLGLKWDKRSDTLKVSFPSENVPATKRGILRKPARIYDPWKANSYIEMCTMLNCHGTLVLAALI